MTATMEDAVGNATAAMVATTELPLDMQFNGGHMVSIVFYPILMVISAVGNITVFVILLRRRKKGRSRINNMLLHLSIADLLVTFLMMPLETAWNYTVVWRGGDALCRIMSFYRTFGIYLSSNILVCISVDRYFAVLKPMQISDRRGRWMLVGAWVLAIVCSLPQVVVFQALTHPDYPWYVQCISWGTLTTQEARVIYAAFATFAIYVVPLSVIIFSYASILVEIFKRSRDPVDDKLRRSSLGFLGRAKIRTLKMTIIIVFVFFVCSTPYHVMMVWYWVDENAAHNVDPRLQKGLLLFASANSCMNPIVYGAFNIRTRRSGTSQDGGAGGAGAGGGEGAGAASTGSSSEHAAHVLCHRGSRGSQGSEVSIPLSALSATPTTAVAAAERKLTLKSALKGGSKVSAPGPADPSSVRCRASSRSPRDSRRRLGSASQKTIAFASPNGAAAPLASPPEPLAALAPPALAPALASMGAVCSSCGETLRASLGAPPLPQPVPDVTAVAVARERAELAGAGHLR
ncbi:Gonadotropin-releasing hormone II receptor [Frankliniella fusca]|uniref:Gonadotropin-releasing hormone II receptor n=1 Tax=Frankliniella fusca TaxID=407009 RepID=A0AAE1I317_9NEOP|nr:Gonadotropin-releasing hormone II receptor [Frankliniella fusca]